MWKGWLRALSGIFEAETTSLAFFVLGGSFLSALHGAAREFGWESGGPGVDLGTSWEN